MVPVRVRHGAGGKNAVDALPAQDQPSVVRESKSVAARSITEMHPSVADRGAIRRQVVQGNIGRAGTPDPGFDREVLHPEGGGIAEVDPVPVGSIKDERLPEDSRTVGYFSGSRHDTV